MPANDAVRLFVSTTPQDQTVQHDMIDFISLAQKDLGLYEQIYAATLPEFYEATEAAITRSCVTEIVADATQGVGHVEAPLLQAFLGRVDHAIIGVGTSMLSHQLIHDKKLLANVPVTPEQHAAVASIDPLTFSTWQEAMLAGYPVVWFGSWNFSPAASKQANTVAVAASYTLACYFAGIIDQNFQWIKAHEPHIHQVVAALAEPAALATLTREG